MRRTLRRSCESCAKAKQSCDLGTPCCSRCTKRNLKCIYANEPLHATANPPSGSPALSCGPLTSCRFPPVDPFESYPPTRLPRDHVQRLIHSCKSSLPMNYYRKTPIGKEGERGISWPFPSGLTGASPPQDCFPILPSRSEPSLQSLFGLVVANSAW